MACRWPFLRRRSAWSAVDRRLAFSVLSSDRPSAMRRGVVRVIGSPERSPWSRMARKLAWSRTAEDVAYALPCTRYPRAMACDIRGACAVNSAWVMRGDCLAVRLPALDGATCSRCRCCCRLGHVPASLCATVDEHGQREEGHARRPSVYTYIYIYKRDQGLL